MKVDILAFGAHPDDVELQCGGTLLKAIANGKKVAIVDLTRGEMGTRGNSEIRAEEAAKAAELLGAVARHNLNLPDSFLENDREAKLAVARMVRFHEPDIVLAGALSDRHPDHGTSAKIVSDGCFIAGLVKVETEYEGHEQQAWRPRVVYHYIQDRFNHPDFVVDVTAYYDQKIEVCKAHASQFHNPASGEPETILTDERFFEKLKARHIEMGRQAGFELAEGFNVERVPGVTSIDQLI